MAMQGKVAIVTGAGTGIGKAAALALLREGYRVVLAGRRKEPLEQVIGEAGAGAGRALGVATDVSDPASVRRCSRRRRRAFGRLDRAVQQRRHRRARVTSRT